MLCGGSYEQSDDDSFQASLVGWKPWLTTEAGEETMSNRAALILALAVLVLAVLSLVACVTPYQPKNWNGGYTDFEVQPGVIYLSFEGNGFTSREVVVRYWHRRASEICPGGYDMLSIADIGQTHVGSSGTQVFSVRRPANEGYIHCVEE
jgi:hypothetical protein